MKRFVYLIALICTIVVIIPSAVAAASFTSSAGATPSTAAPGAAITINTLVKTDTAMSLLVDLEVYGPNGQKAFQQWWNNQSFAANQQRSFSTSWTTPANTPLGTYTIKIGLFRLVGERCITGAITPGSSACLPARRWAPA